MAALISMTWKQSYRCVNLLKVVLSTTQAFSETQWYHTVWKTRVPGSVPPSLPPSLPLSLQRYAGSDRQLIGALNAASNITGVMTDTNTFSATLHRHGALALWDFATAGKAADPNVPKKAL